MKSLARPCSSRRLLGRRSPCHLSSQSAHLGHPPPPHIQTQRHSAEDSPGTILRSLFFLSLQDGRTLMITLGAHESSRIIGHLQVFNWSTSAKSLPLKDPICGSREEHVVSIFGGQRWRHMTSGHGLGARSGHFLLNSRYAHCFPGFWETLTYFPLSSQALNLLTCLGICGGVTPLISKYFFQSSRFSKWF